ncbi:poly-gamma-glutamate hydrolase family protein, partial [Sulfurovum riftiae]|uniref:poly-gamma-glutamate hydrolase family protein n=1 Tax=Sulfurovum riftiae TaxID=1630136 RepID=UPI00165F431C
MVKEYDNFKELEKNELGNYFIECIDRGSNVTMLAPHGGRIEPRTDAIAKAIACQNFNYYGFIAERSKIEGRKNMHITSHKFDEPKAIELIKKSEIVIAIHGCNDRHSKRDDKKEIFIG